MATHVEGDIDPKFSRVRDVLAEILDAPHELGAAVSVVIDGRAVVDVWGGYTNRDRTKRWSKDTLANVFSTTKGWTALCALRLVDRGELDLDAPVASYWPEFAQADKGRIPVRWLLSHRAGLPAIRAALPPEALFDWTTMTTALAAEAPFWTPGEKHGYHAVTLGWLVGEVIRRASGMTVAELFRRELAGPLGLDAHVSVDDVDDSRCAELRFGRKAPGDPPTLVELMMTNPELLATRAFTNPPSLANPSVPMTREFRAAGIPSIGGHATAAAIAKLYGAVARGDVLSTESLQRAGTEDARGEDLVLGVETQFSTGFMLSLPESELGRSEGSFGHPGAGGSVGFADPSTKLGFGYVPNRLGTRIKLDARALRLIEATYASL